jgi:uncharacterized protein (DUF885 family)
MRYKPWPARVLTLVLALGLAACAAPTAPGKSSSAAAEVNALFEEYWEWVLRQNPEWATFLGDHRYADRLTDESVQAIRRRAATRNDYRSRLNAIDAASLPPALRTSVRVLRDQLDRAAAIDASFGDLPFGVFDEWAPITQMDGMHLGLHYLIKASRFETTADHDAYLKRLEQVPVNIGELIARMQTAMAAGWMPPRIAIRDVPKQLDAQLLTEPAQSPLYVPFKALPQDIAPADRQRLTHAAQTIIRSKVVPAFQTLKTFYESRYLPAAASQLGASSLPGGLAYYQALLGWFTTTDLNARQIHELGLKEVARINEQMDATVSATGFKGTRAEFHRFIATDPRFFFTKPEDMLAAYRDIAKRVDAELPKLFAVLPRQTYGIRPMSPEEGNNAESYTSGAADGSRAGFFNANTNDLSTRPKWAMETLLLHETVPGHHLQSARAQELTDLPQFRRHSWFTAYGEGWALYAESLGDELGMYQDPYQKFGNLSDEMLRACRLVVDTGLHAFGWSRDRAIEYMVANTGQTRDAMIAEVDRYIVWPGQATAYKVGQLKIKELRAKAKAVLGERFDVRRFHNAVIDGGALPLQVLEAQIEEWIAGQLAVAK